MAVNVVLTETDWRMIKDDSFFSVTPKDVANLLYRMACAQMPRKDIIRMRIKYDPWINDPEKQFMEELGLDYRTHVITKNFLSRCFHVNGYSKKQWLMLTDESYVPPMIALMNFITLCRKRNDVAALEILLLKYQESLKQRDEKIIKKYNLPAEMEYERLDCSGRVDGTTVYLWRLLHDDSFVPPNKGTLVSTINNLRKKDRIEDAEAIEQKYIRFLSPEVEEPDVQEEIQAAREFFRTLYPYSFYD